MQVTQKAQELSITETDAVFEVYTDRFVNELQSCDKVLLWIFGQDMNNFSVSSLVTIHYVHIRTYVFLSHYACVYIYVYVC